MSDSLPFTLLDEESTIRLALRDHVAFGGIRIDLELELPRDRAPHLLVPIERLQRRRMQLRAMTLRLDRRTLDAHVAARTAALADDGVRELAVRIEDGSAFVSARIADGLTAADLGFRVTAASRGRRLRIYAGSIRVFGHLSTPAPLLAHRILEKLVGQPLSSLEAAPAPLCELELDVVSSALWHILPPAGWRLPSAAEMSVAGVRIGDDVIVLELGAGRAGGPVGSAMAHRLAAAHAAMRVPDELLRGGSLDEAMRGYRNLLAVAGPSQPLVLERALAIAAARPAWFIDGVDLARHALARWPELDAAQGALASIAVARGDSAEAVARFTALSDLALRAGDRSTSGAAALAAARLARTFAPDAGDELYERVLRTWPDHDEAGDALSARLAELGRWGDRVTLLENRARALTDPRRAGEAWGRAAIACAEKLGAHDRARRALEAAQRLAPDLPVTGEAEARLAVATGDHAAAAAAWTRTAEVAAERGDRPAQITAMSGRARAIAQTGDLVAAARAWGEVIALDPHHPDGLRGAAGAAAAAADHRLALALYGRCLAVAGDVDGSTHLAIGRSHAALGDTAAAVTELERAAAGEAGVALDALAALADVQRANDPAAAAAALDRAIERTLALGGSESSPELATRAAQLGLARAELTTGLERIAELRRVYRVAGGHAPDLARRAAAELADTAELAVDELGWIDALLATHPQGDERARWLLRRVDVHLRGSPPAVDRAAVDAHQAAEHARSPALAHAAARAVAEVARAAGDRAGQAQALSRQAEVSTASHSPATTIAAEHGAAAAAWLDAGDAGKALAHGRAAMALVARASGASAADRVTIAAVLGEAAWRLRDLAEVVTAYDAILAAGGEPPDRAVAQLRLATALAPRGESPRAIALLGEAAPVLDGELRTQAYEQLAQLQLDRGEPLTAATTLETLAADPALPAVARADILYRAGELYRRDPDQIVAAIRCLEAAVGLVDDHLPALDALEFIGRDQRDPTRIATVLALKLAAARHQPDRQKELLCRIAALLEQLERISEAKLSARRALAIDPHYRPALRLLAGLARNSGEIEELAQALACLTEAADTAPPGDEPIAAALELATLIVEHPARLGGWRDRAVAACDALRDHARVEPNPLVEAAERLRVIGAPPSSASRAARAAADAARSTGDLLRARRILEAAVDLGDPRVGRELAEVCADQGDWPACARALERLIELLDSPPTTRPLPGHRKADVLLELADLYYDRIGDLARARAAVRRAADASPPSTRRDSALRLLAAEAAATEDYREVADALQLIERGRRTPADQQLLATARERAGLAKDTIPPPVGRPAAARSRLQRPTEIERLAAQAATTGDLAAAADLYADAIAARARAGTDPTGVPIAIERMRALARAAGHTDALIRALFAVAGRAPKAVALELYREAAAAAGADLEIAVDALLRAHHLAPADGELVSSLADLLEVGGDFALLADIYQRTARATIGPERARWLLALAAIHRDRLGDPRGARNHLDAAHLSAPDAPAIWLPLADARLADGDLPGARALYERVVANPAIDAGVRRWAVERLEALRVRPTSIAGANSPEPSPESDGD